MLYRDSKGSLISEGEVVIDNNGWIYKVDGFKEGKEFPVKLSNGCSHTFNKPENLTVIICESQIPKR